MKAEQSNACTERILALLVLLLQGKHSREDIFAKIAAYHRDAEPASELKMLERGLSTLERAGRQVECKSGRHSVAMEEFGRPALRECTHEAIGRVWDAAILL